MDNLTKVTRNKRDNYSNAFGDNFTSYFMEAMGQIRDSVKVNKNDDANITLTNVKGALNMVDLRQLQGIKKTRDKKRRQYSKIKIKRTVEVR